MLRPDVLELIRALIAVTAKATPSSRNEVVPLLEVLGGPVFESIHDQNPKVAVAALTAAQEFIIIVLSSPRRTTLAHSLFGTILKRLCQRDGPVDPDVMRSVVETTAKVVVALAPDLATLAPNVSAAEEEIVKLLKQETIRIHAAKAIAVILDTTVPIGLLTTAAGELTVLLRKNDRSLRETALFTLTKLIEREPSSVSQDVAREIIGLLGKGSAMKPLINDDDLFLATNAMLLAKSLIGIASVRQEIVQTVVPAAIDFVRNKLVQGRSLSNAQLFFQQLAGAVDPMILVVHLQKAIDQTPELVPNLAVPLAGVVSKMKNPGEFAADLLKLPNKVTAVTCIGEIGRIVRIHPETIRTLLSACTDNDESLRIAASIALGRTASHCENEMVLDLLHGAISQRPPLVYYYYRSIKELVLSTPLSFEPSSTIGDPQRREKLLRSILLVHHFDDEGLVEQAGECLGRLTVLDPEIVSTVLAPSVCSDSAVVRAASLFACKFCVAGNDVLQSHQRFVAMLPQVLQNFSRQQPILVRRAMLQLFHLICSNRPRLLLDIPRDEVVRALVAEMTVDPQLVHEIDLGPFKHRVDKGLEVRKVAFDCANALVVAQSKITSLISPEHYSALLERIAKSCGPPDEPETDVNSLARRAILKIAVTAPQLLAPFLSTLNAKLKAPIEAKSKEPQDHERLKDAAKQAIACLIRIVHALPESRPVLAESIKSAEASPYFVEARQMTE
jgi:cullin-associated NEDD8-dissociated protein 1